jgi:hypothetical protein
MRYQQPYGITDINASYINGDPSIGRMGSIPPAAAFEQPMREIVAVISNSDYIPLDTDLIQLTKSVRRQYLNFAIDTGTANAMAVTLSPPLDQYHPGLPLRVLVAFGATGPTTINVNGLGLRQVLRSDGGQLHSGDTTAGMIANLVDTGTAFQLQNPLMAPSVTTNTYMIDIPYCRDISGTPNAIIAPFSPALTTAQVTEGKFISVMIAQTNTGPTVIYVNSYGGLYVLRDDGQHLQAGDIFTGLQVLLENHGNYWQCLGLVRSQIFHGVAPALRMFIADQAGFGASYVPTTQPTIISYPRVVRNTLRNSAYDGWTFVCGSGEQGVWSIRGSIHWSQIGWNCNYTDLVIHCVGGPQGGSELAIGTTEWEDSNTACNAQCTCLFPLYPGDAIQCWAYQQSGHDQWSMPWPRTAFQMCLVST